MNEQIAKFIAELGYDFSIDENPIVGKWQQVSTPNFKGAWICDTHTLKDTTVLILTIHDYRKSQSFTEKFATRELSKWEQKNVDDKIKKQKEEAQKEKERKWTECRAYCLQEWDAANPNCEGHPYLERKGVRITDAKFGIRTRLNFAGETDLLIPMHDVDNMFWGYQTIHENGSKHFALGQRLEELFYKIPGENAGRIYLCEGVATGLSIHQALDGKFPVFCAFAASNIKKTAISLRKKFPKTPIIICADNDKWKPDIGNTGVRVAEETERALEGVCICVPQFEGFDESTKPTDFNDLHNIAGIEVVQKQIESVAIVRPHVVYSLGYNDRTHYFTTSANPQVQMIKEFSSTEFLSIAPLKFWQQSFSDEKGNVDWLLAKDHLIRRSEKIGIYDPGKLRGRGIHFEDGEIVIHLGNRLYYPNGTEKDLADVETDNIYDPRPKTILPEKCDIPIHKCLEVISKLSWRHAFEPKLFAGWLFSAPLAGVNSWRPHIAVTAQAGSGKSTLLKYVLRPVFKYSGMLEYAGGTEASMRQDIRTDSLPVALDEFDSHSVDKKKFSSIMSLARVAASEGYISRGTPSGKALKFHAKFSCMFVGVNMHEFNDPDESRFAQLEMTPEHKTAWEELKPLLIETFNDEVSRAFFWRTYNLAQNYLKSVEVFSSLIASESNSRMGDLYGHLLAGYWHWKNVEVVTKELAKPLIAELNQWTQKDTTPGTQKRNEAENCMEHLLQFPIKTDEDRNLVILAQVLSSEAVIDSKNAMLEPHGLKLTKDGLFVSSQSPTLQRHFSGTQWTNWTKSLMRIPKVAYTQQRIGVARPRGVLVPQVVKVDPF